MDEDPIYKEKEQMKYQWEIDDRNVVARHELENQERLWRQRWGKGAANTMKNAAEGRLVEGKEIRIETGKIVLPNGRHETGMGLIRNYGGRGVMVDTVRVISRAFEDAPIEVKVTVGSWTVCSDLMRERDVFPLEPPVFVEEGDIIEVDGGVGSRGPRSVELEGAIFSEER